MDLLGVFILVMLVLFPDDLGRRIGKVRYYINVGFMEAHTKKLTADKKKADKQRQKTMDALTKPHLSPDGFSPPPTPTKRTET